MSNWLELQTNAGDVKTNINSKGVMSSSNNNLTISASISVVGNTAREMEELSNKIYSFMYTVGRIETYTKELERKNSEGIKNKLKLQREKAKKESRWLLEKIEEISERNKDDKSFQKITKQFKEQFERFQKVSRYSIHVEKLYLMKLNRNIEEKEPIVDDRHNALVTKFRAEQEEFEQRLLLAEYDQRAIETEKAIAEERLNDLKELETDMDQLMHTYVEIRDLIQVQGESIDEIEKNVEEASFFVEEGVEYIKTSKESLKHRLFFMIVSMVFVALATIGVIAFIVI
ncbi:hypothetical protein ABK040_012343 [Willaertia magna]